MTDIFTGLNDKQIEAVRHYEGPLLILAGAGSGKTRVLTHRIAYLIEEKNVNPYNILGLTFTNKAAREMKERVDNIVPFEDNIWVSTFHSTCVRILRRYIDHIDYDRAFSIYDSDDQKNLVKDIIKYFNLDPKKHKPKTYLNEISNAKNELISPESYSDKWGNTFEKKYYIKVYSEYQKRLKSNNALDFDDLIMKTVELLTSNKEILDYYQERFKFILVDEYQDTNTAQFNLITLLAGKYHNLCVVGDDDQSIYKFRGANINNILNFEDFFKATKVIRLEQNYRSTQNILDAAYEVIRHNKSRKEKKLWTDAPKGSPIFYANYETEYEEAEGIAYDIHKKSRDNNQSYSDFAILYRTNAQSRVFEEKLIYHDIPYKIVGGINFYARKEIKDILCYLKAINNSADEISIKRIINIPKRGIGQSSLNRLSDYAQTYSISFFDALYHANEIPGIKRAIPGIESFLSLIENLRSKLNDSLYSLEELFDDLIEKTEYIEALEADNKEDYEQRIENIDSLRNKVIQYENDASTEMPTLSGLLEDIALIADIDSVDDNNDKVLLMTLHSAKGLEFPDVYICGMEESLFPSAISIYGEDPSEIEEERRLCYVGITRAKNNLTLTNAQRRMRNGELNFNKPSRFILEIPRYLMKLTSGFLPKNEAKPDYSASSFSNIHTDNAFSNNKNNIFSNNPYIQKGFSNKATNDNDNATNKPAYSTGDRVTHFKFGDGKVLELNKLDNDYEVVVEFDVFGRRKLRSSFAKLEKIWYNTCIIFIRKHYERWYILCQKN